MNNMPSSSLRNLASAIAVNSGLKHTVDLSDDEYVWLVKRVRELIGPGPELQIARK